MHKLPELVAFDLDDTLAPSKSALPAAICDLLAALLAKTRVAIISGGNLAQFEKQVIAPLSTHSGARDVLHKLHLLPTCGTQYLTCKNGIWRSHYRETLTAEQKQRALAALETHAKALGLWESAPWGQILEDRETQITFSALGQEAPVAAKQAWDPSGAKKNRLATAVQQELPDLAVRSGGSTSVDITRQGIDKAYGMQKLVAHTGIGLDQMLFIGDRLDAAGNDYPVLELGVKCQAVTSHHDTVEFLTRLLAGAATHCDEKPGS